MYLYEYVIEPPILQFQKVQKNIQKQSDFCFVPNAPPPLSQFVSSQTTDGMSLCVRVSGCVYFQRCYVRDETLTYWLHDVGQVT